MGVNIAVHVTALSSLGYIPRSGIAQEGWSLGSLSQRFPQFPCINPSLNTSHQNHILSCTLSSQPFLQGAAAGAKLMTTQKGWGAYVMSPASAGPTALHTDFHSPRTPRPRPSVAVPNLHHRYQTHSSSPTAFLGSLLSTPHFTSPINCPKLHRSHSIFKIFALIVYPGAITWYFSLNHLIFNLYLWA